MPHLDVPALFVRDGQSFIPTRYTQGPWDPNLQHGGPISALLAVAAEEQPTLVPMRTQRYTFDLMRPVPIAPLTTSSRIVRNGKKLQLVESAILHDGVEVARATVLRMRVLDTAELDDHPLRPPVAPPRLPTDGNELTDRSLMTYVPGFIDAIDTDRIAGGRGLGIPATVWFHCKVPIVLDEEVSPAVTLALMADFTSGLASYLDYERYAAINADVTVHVLRDPSSDWIAVDTTCWYGGDGLGQSQGKLFDTAGLCALTNASLVIDRNRAPMFRQPPG